MSVKLTHTYIHMYIAYTHSVKVFTAVIPTKQRVMLI